MFRYRYKKGSGKSFLLIEPAGVRLFFIASWMLCCNIDYYENREFEIWRTVKPSEQSPEREEGTNGTH